MHLDGLIENRIPCWQTPLREYARARARRWRRQQGGQLDDEELHELIVERWIQTRVAQKISKLNAIRISLDDPEDVQCSIAITSSSGAVTGAAPNPHPLDGRPLPPGAVAIECKHLEEFRELLGQLYPAPPPESEQTPLAAAQELVAEAQELATLGRGEGDPSSDRIGQAGADLLPYSVDWDSFVFDLGDQDIVTGEPIYKAVCTGPAGPKDWGKFVDMVEAEGVGCDVAEALSPYEPGPPDFC